MEAHIGQHISQATEMQTLCCKFAILAICPLSDTVMHIDIYIYIYIKQQLINIL